MNYQKAYTRSQTRLHYAQKRIEKLEKALCKAHRNLEKERMINKGSKICENHKNNIHSLQIDKLMTQRWVA